MQGVQHHLLRQADETEAGFRPEGWQQPLLLTLLELRAARPSAGPLPLS